MAFIYLLNIPKNSLPSKVPAWKLGLLMEEGVYPHSMAYLCNHIQLESLSNSTITQNQEPIVFLWMSNHLSFFTFPMAGFLEYAQKLFWLSLFCD